MSQAKKVTLGAVQALMGANAVDRLVVRSRLPIFQYCPLDIRRRVLFA